MKRWFIIAAAIFVFSGQGAAATFYVDPAKGNDGAAGTSAAPWRTLNKAKVTAKAGDMVYLRPGSYGPISYSPSNSGVAGSPITYKGDPATIAPRAGDWYSEPLSLPGPAQRPIISNISLAQGSHHLEFEGFDITGGGGIICLNSVHNITIRRINIIGVWGATAADVRPRKAIHFHQEVGASGVSFHDILVEECYLGMVGSSVHVRSVDGNVVIRGNHFYHLSNSCIRIHPINQGPLLIEGNHIHHYVVLPVSPTNSDPTHMSGISLYNATSKRFEIRNNIIHGCGSTSSLTLYDESCNYTNALIENNLIYDPRNEYYMAKLRGSGSNFVVRNNTFIGRVRPSQTNYKHYGSLMAGNYPFYNNIVIGNVMGPSSQATYNIVFYSGSLNPATNNIIYSGSGPLPDYFEESGNLFVGGANFPWTPAHGKTINDAFKLAPGSEAINYGTAGQAPAKDILGNPRDAQPDAGAFEYTTTGLHPEIPCTKSQTPIKNIKTQQGMYDLTGKQIPENTRKTGLYLVQEGNSLKKVMVFQ